MRRRVGGALAVVAALGALSTLPARARAPIVTQSHQSTSPVSNVRAYGSPAVVVDPDDPRRVLAAGVDFRTGACTFQSSGDGGTSWRQSGQPPSVPGSPLCLHNLGQMPTSFLSMGRDKALYWAHVASSIDDQPNLSVFLSRSTDLGETWTSAAVRDARGKRGTASERNIVMDLAVDTAREAGDIVYVAWMAALPLATPPRARQAMVVSSLDGGRTFSAPVDPADSFFREPGNLPAGVTFDRRQGGQIGALQPNLAVDGRGNVHVVWLEFVIGDPFHSPVRWRRVYVSRSSDQGRTFTEHSLVRTMTTDGVGVIGPMLEWSPRGGPEGSLHLVYESRKEPAQGDRDVQYHRSVDGNRTWSEVKVLNDDDPKQLFGQFLPNVQVAPNGRVDVVWWDLRDGAADYANDVYYGYSTDNGSTWSPNFRVTDQSIDRKIGTWSNNFDYRAPPSIASTDETALVAWDQTSSDGPWQDLMMATVQLTELPADNAAIPYVVAALLGLAAGGLALLAVASAVRSRQDAARQDAHVREEEAAGHR